MSFLDALPIGTGSPAAPRRPPQSRIPCPCTVAATAWTWCGLRLCGGKLVVLWWPRAGSGAPAAKVLASCDTARGLRAEREIQEAGALGAAGSARGWVN
jgi:hypothetical protein